MENSVQLQSPLANLIVHCSAAGCLDDRCDGQLLQWNDVVPASNHRPLLNFFPLSTLLVDYERRLTFRAPCRWGNAPETDLRLSLTFQKVFSSRISNVLERVPQRRIRHSCHAIKIVRFTGLFWHVTGTQMAALHRCSFEQIQRFETSCVSPAA